MGHYLHIYIAFACEVESKMRLKVSLPIVRIIFFSVILTEKLINQLKIDIRFYCFLF